MDIGHMRIYTDGGARGNPGPAGIGAVLYALRNDGSEELLAEISEYIGETTNNQAEYRALLAALEKAQTWKPERIDVRMDSELIVKQIKGEYRVKNEDLASLYLKVVALISKVPHITFTHVARERNAAADRLVNLAIDRARSKEKLK